MDQTCIVVANAARARLFVQQAPNGALQEVADLVNPAARLRTAETETDKLGPSSAGKSIHNTGGALPNKAYQPAHTPTEHETEQFARHLAGHLLEQYQQGQFQHLAIVASPELLGVLRGQLATQLEKAVNWQINKDYSHLSGAQLRDQIAEQKQKQHD